MYARRLCLYALHVDAYMQVCKYDRKMHLLYVCVHACMYGCMYCKTVTLI